VLAQVPTAKFSYVIRFSVSQNSVSSAGIAGKSFVKFLLKSVNSVSRTPQTAVRTGVQFRGGGVFFFFRSNSKTFKHNAKTPLTMRNVAFPIRASSAD